MRSRGRETSGGREDSGGGEEVGGDTEGSGGEGVGAEKRVVGGREVGGREKSGGGAGEEGEWGQERELWEGGKLQESEGRGKDVVHKTTYSLHVPAVLKLKLKTSKDI